MWKIRYNSTRMEINFFVLTWKPHCITIQTYQWQSYRQASLLLQASFCDLVSSWWSLYGVRCHSGALIMLHFMSNSFLASTRWHFYTSMITQWLLFCSNVSWCILPSVPHLPPLISSQPPTHPLYTESMILVELEKVSWKSALLARYVFKMIMKH